MCVGQSAPFFLRNFLDLVHLGFSQDFAWHGGRLRRNRPS